MIYIIFGIKLYNNLALKDSFKLFKVLTQVIWESPLKPQFFWVKVNIFIKYLISKFHMTTFSFDSQDVSSWKTSFIFTHLFSQHSEKPPLKDQN